MFTVFGANGFIGGTLCRFLEESGQEVRRVARDADPATLGSLGHAVFCIGVTADFRTRPYATMDAHVTLPARILRDGAYESFLYLSSTRVYDGAETGNEGARIALDPSNPSDLYNLSKLSGETLCLNHPNPAVRIARLSNVFGEAMFPEEPENANFLADVIHAAVVDGRIVLGTHPASAKDYVDVSDVARALALIAIGGEQRLYNVAAGRKIAHGDILDELSRLTGCRTETSADAPRAFFPNISTGRLDRLFASTGAVWAPQNLTDRLSGLVDAAREKWPIMEGAVA